MKAKPSAAARPSAAENGGSGVTPDYDTAQHAHAQNKTKRIGEAERSAVGVSRVSPYCDSATRPCAKEAKRSDHAERSGKRVPIDFNRNPRSDKLRTNAKKRVACKKKRRSLCFVFFPRIRTLMRRLKKSPISAKI